MWRIIIRGLNINIIIWIINIILRRKKGNTWRNSNFNRSFKVRQRTTEICFYRFLLKRTSIISNWIIILKHRSNWISRRVNFLSREVDICPRWIILWRKVINLWINLSWNNISLLRKRMELTIRRINLWNIRIMIRINISLWTNKIILRNRRVLGSWIFTAEFMGCILFFVEAKTIINWKLGHFYINIFIFFNFNFI